MQDLATHDSPDTWLQEEHPIDVWVKCFADRKAKVSFGTLDLSPSEELWENVVEPIPLREVASVCDEAKTPLKFESRLRAVREALGTQSHPERDLFDVKSEDSTSDVELSGMQSQVDGIEDSDVKDVLQSLLILLRKESTKNSQLQDALRATS